MAVYSRNGYDWASVLMVPEKTVRIIIRHLIPGRKPSLSRRGHTLNILKTVFKPLKKVGLLSIKYSKKKEPPSGCRLSVRK